MSASACELLFTLMYGMHVYVFMCGVCACVYIYVCVFSVSSILDSTR